YPGSDNNTSSIAFYADNPAAANAALNGLIMTPDPNYNGTIYLNFYVTDTTSTSYYGYASGSTTINVTPVNDAPVAVPDSYQAFEDQTFYSYYNYPGYSLLWND